MLLFCCATGNLFGNCIYIVVYVHVLLLDKKNESASIEHIVFRIYVHLSCFHPSFLSNIAKLNIRIGGWKHIAKEGLKNGGYIFGDDL